MTRHLLHDHVAGFASLLRDLSARVTCGSIMTPWSDVACVTGVHGRETKASAKQLMDAGRYSSVPLVGDDGAVRGKYLRWTPEGSIAFENAQPHHFIAAEASGLNLLARMAEHNQIAMCVGTADDAHGWITFADFSKRPFRLLLFAIVSEVEYLLARAIDEHHPQDGWLELAGALPPGEQSDLKKRREEAREWDALMPLTTFADIGHLVRVACASPAVCERLGLTPGNSDRLRMIADLRNRVAHTVRPVVAGPGAIQTTAGHVRLLRELIDRWSAAIV
jgi:hypothetical protein